MARVLIVFTNTYPYGSGEPFIGSEIPLLAPLVDQVVLVPTQVRRGTSSRELPPGVECWPVDEPTGTASRLGSFISGAMRSVVTGSGARLWDGGGSLTTVRLAAAFEARAQSCWAQLERRLRRLTLHDGDEVTLYSYWLHHPARVAELAGRWLRRHRPGVRLRLVSRAHGYDLYAERSAVGRLPQRDALLGAFDAIHPVSKPGETYLRERFPRHAERISVRHLGSPDPEPRPAPSRDRLRIATCAYVTAVKRLDRVPAIIERVAEAGIEVVWTHVGDGPDFEALKRLSATTNRLADVQFLGAVPSGELFETYRTHPATLLLSVSSSEGVPVSMMEALSIGVPIIATDVGGVSDIVVPDESGLLISADLDDSEAADAIAQLWRLDDDSHAALSASARRLWHSQFRAASVYPRFVKDLFPAV